MKRIFYTAILLTLPVMAYCQQLAFAADQNPRYKESQDRYLKMADSLTTFHGITIQQTYKAYDWYEAKLERRKQNREWRHQERMNRRYITSYYPDYNPYNNYYGNPWGRQYQRFWW